MFTKSPPLPRNQDNARLLLVFMLSPCQSPYYHSLIYNKQNKYLEYVQQLPRSTKGGTNHI